MEFVAVDRSHYQQIVNLVNSPEELYVFYPAGHYPFDIKQLEELMEKRDNLTVMLEDGKVIAFANLYNIKPKDSVFIGNVLVGNSHRGMGVGRQLTDHMCKIARDEYQATPHLSVFNFNARALLMYTSLGFKPYAIEPRVGLNSEQVALIHMKCV